MKKAAAVFTAFLIVAGILTGVYGRKEDRAISAAEQEISSEEIPRQEAEIQKETSDEEDASGAGTEDTSGADIEDAAAAGAESTEDTQETANPDVPLIDTSVPIHAGAHIAVVSKNTQGSYWELVYAGMKAAVQDVNEAYGFEKDEQISMTFEGSNDETDVETQINTLDAVISENPDVLCLSAVDVNSCQAQLETARENGIPVVAFDSGVSEEELIYAYCGTDNVTVGKMAAERLVEALDGKGKIAVFSIQEKTQSIQERIQGFTQVIGQYPEIQVVEMVYQDQVTDMTAAMQAVLTLHPDLAGIFCSNADITDMYLNLDKADGSPDPVLVGVDATKRQQEAVLSGEELGIVSQNPYAIGYQTIWTALAATRLENADTAKQDVILDPVWIDSVNIEDPACSSYLYQ